MQVKQITRFAVRLTAMWLIAASGSLAQAPAAQKPAEAAAMMASAYKQAKEAKKPVLVVFGATW